MLKTLARVTPRACALVGTAVLLLLCACGGGPAPGDTDFQLGRLVTERSVVCAPGADWIAAQDGWSYRGIASVACWIEEPPPQLVLEIASPEPPFGLGLSWDSVDVGKPVLVDGRHRFTLPGSLLSRGAHVLEVRRVRLAKDTAPQRLHVSELAVGAASAPRSFSPRDVDRDSFLSDFLAFGSAGEDGDRRAGVLFHGSGELTVPGPFPAAASALRIEPENRSPAPAIFTVQTELDVDGKGNEYVILEPGERRSLELALPRGSDGIRLAVEGAADGLFFFGAPRLKLAAGELDGPPLIVLITLDTTRRDILGAYGAPPGVTPRLDALAAGATVYERALSTAPWTLPAHGSMFTGLYPSRHGAGVRRRTLGPGVPTLAGLLTRAGYVSAGLAGGRMMAHRFGGGRGFTYYLDPEDGVRSRGDVLTDNVVALLPRVADENLFLFVNYFDPHWAYSAPAPYAAAAGVPAARAALRVQAWRSSAAGNAAQWARIVHGEVEPTPQGLAWLRAAYEAEVRFMDAEVGRLFAELQQRGLWERALVAVVADHGELLGERGLYSHAYRLEPELVEVPLIVKWPRQREARRADGLVSVADLFPSLLGAAGVEAPPGDGLVLPGAPFAAEAAGHGRVLYEEHANRVHALDNAYMRLAAHLWGVQDRSRRRIVWKGGEECAERHGEGWQETPCNGSQEAFLRAVEDNLGGVPKVGEEEAGEVNEEERAALKALGYL